MKRMQQTGCLLLVMVLMLLLLTGCGAKDEWEAARNAAQMLDNITEDAQLRADTERMLDAIIADDYQAAWDAIYQEMDATEFRRVYVELQPMLRGITQYELVPSNINKTVRNGVAFVSVRYMMTAGDLRVFVDVSRTEGYEGLTAFRLTEYIPVVTTGTLGNMQGANGVQWIFLVIGLLELVFTLCVFVDCCRHKMKKKWLWLLFVGLGYLVIRVIAMPEQFHVNFKVGAFLNYTNLVRYSTGGFVASVMIPVGAIVYLLVRKSLFAKYAQLQQQTTDQLPAQPEPVFPTEETADSEAQV